MNSKNVNELFVHPAVLKLLEDIGRNPIVRCGVCGNVTAVYRTSDDGLYICARHFGEGSDEERELATDTGRSHFVELLFQAGHEQSSINNPQWLTSHPGWREV